MYKFILYHFAPCPLSRAVRIALKEKDQAFATREVKPWLEEEALLLVNPAGTTPVLIVNDDTPVQGFYPVIEFLEELDLEPKLILGSPADKAKIRSVICWFAEKFYREVTEYLLFEKIIRRLSLKGSPNSTAIITAKKNLEYHLDYLNYLLSNNSYLTGETITMADLVAAAQLSIIDLLGDIAWDKVGKVKGWYALIKSRPSFQSILKDGIQGLVIPKHYLDPDF
jgi:glutathione S-transferase